MNIVLLLAIIGEKINIHCGVVTSQPHWFSGPQLDISKFSVFNHFLVYSQITYCNFVLRCDYGKGNFQRWMNACTNVIKRSLEISILYLSTSFFHLYVFSGEKCGWYIYCLPRLTLSLWENGTSPALHDLISYIAPPAPGLSYITIYW